MKLWLETNADHIRMSSPAAAASEASEASSLDLDKFLLRFLRAQKFDVGRAEAMMEKYLELRRVKPQWFQIDSKNSKHLMELLSNGFLTVLPEQDEEGRVCVFHQPSVADPSRHSIEVNF